jgi:hypothetical protein
MDSAGRSSVALLVKYIEITRQDKKPPTFGGHGYDAF